MEHPSISVPEIKESMTLDEIHGKIVELTNKLSFAYRMSNQPLINQIQMALECYQRAQREILDEMFSGDGKNPTDNINIS